MADFLYKYTLHNYKMVVVYNKDCEKPIKRYANAVYRVDKISDIMGQIKDAMYNPNKEQKKIIIQGLIELYFTKEIEFIFSNRRQIRNQEYLNEWSGKLFSFMQYVNSSDFRNFKNIVSDSLTYIASIGTYTDEEIKESIAKLISKALRHDFIKL